MLNEFQQKLCDENTIDFSGLKALFVNTSLKKQPSESHTKLLLNVSAEIMAKNGVHVEHIHMLAHDVPPGVYPDMTEHGWDKDDWPEIWEHVKSANILVVGTPLWLGEESSVCRVLIERLYGMSGMLERSAALESGATVFGYYVKDPERYGVIEFDEEGRALTIEEKPWKPRSPYAVPGLYVYDASVLPSASVPLMKAYHALRGGVQLDRGEVEQVSDRHRRRSEPVFQLLRQRFREADKARLGRGIVHLPRIAGGADDGRDVDDMSASFCGHAG